MAVFCPPVVALAKVSELPIETFANPVPGPLSIIISVSTVIPLVNTGLPVLNTNVLPVPV